VSSLPSYGRTTFFIQGILGIQGSRQYTLGVHLLLKVVDHVLVAMFLIGGFGSAFVIVISFAEDMHELFSKND
jgi:hypothetical protein